MISTWYFCSCVESSPKDAQAFLTTVEALQSDQSDFELVRLALGEILKAEQIMRQYAVPVIIASGLLESRSASDVVAAHRDVLTDAFQVLDSRIAENLLSAWSLLRDQARSRSSENVFVALREALTRSIALRPTSLRVEPVPYFHTGDFLSEVAILKLMVHAVRVDAGLLHRFSDDDDFVLLVNDALRNRFGRLALLLAADAAAVLGEEVVSSAVLRRRLLEAPQTAALWEPDVLSALARILFAHAGDLALAESSQQIRGRLLLETITFSRLNSLGSTVVGPTAAHRAIARLGLVGPPDEQTALVLWQAVLWEIAAELDPAGTAEQIEHYWIAPHRPITAPVRVTLPVEPKELRNWTRRASALAGLRLEEGGPIRFEPHSGQFQGSSWLFVAMLSPWMTRARKAKNPRESPFNRITDGLVLLRLLLSTVTAGYLLRQPIPTAHDHLVSLTLHAGDVLADVTYRSHLDALWFDGETSAEPMSEPLAGLALYVRRLIRRLGTGAHAEVDPAWYSDYLSRPPGPTTPEQERIMREGPALQVAWPWIQDALSGSLPNDAGLQGRWRRGHESHGRGHAEQTLRYMVDQSEPWAVHKPAALLKIHFGEDLDRTSLFSWHRNPERYRPNLWSALSADALPAQAWTRLPLSATPGSEAHLALASVRLQSVLAEGSANDPDYSSWVDEWRELVSRIDEPKSFPRALRLFLLHLLDLPLSGAGVESRLLEEFIDAEIEFGFGTPLDRWILFTRLGSDSRLADELAQMLRLRMLRGVYRRVAVPARSNRIRDPWTSRERLQSDDLLARLLQRFVYDLGGHRTDVQRTTVAELVPRMWRAAHQPPRLREVRIDMDTAGPGAIWSVADPRLVVGATVDPVIDVARLHLAREPRSTAAVDAFTSSPDELLDRLRQAAARASSAPDAVTALGVVGALDEASVWVNVGLGTPVQAARQRTYGVGDMVLVDLRAGANGPVVVPGRPARSPETQPVIGDLCPTTVTTTLRNGVPVVTIEPDHEPATVLGGRTHPEHYRRQWAPDLTGLMTGLIGKATGTFLSYARWDGEQWLPADQGLAEFLAVVSASLPLDGDLRRLRLVVVDVLDQTTARYSTAPGSNVLIPHTAWEPDSRKLLVDELDRAGMEATGMVIDAAVRRDENGHPALIVCTGTEPSFPFDRRAEEWRTHFQDGDYEAEWSPERDRFEYDTGVTGFPLVNVDVNTAGRLCRFTVSRWGADDQWRARVVGTPVEERNLTPGKRSRKTFDSLVNLRAGTVLTLNAALAAPRFGMLRGWTTTGLPVEIEPESLTLANLAEPWNERGRGARLIRGREVEISEPPKLLPPRRPQHPRGVSDATLLDWIEDATDRAAAEDHLHRARRPRGILVSEPKNNNQEPDDLLRVWLDLGGTIAEGTLRRDEFDNAAVGVGADVSADRNTRGDWEFHGRSRRVQVRARWQLREEEPPDTVPALFLGTVVWKGARCAVAQARNWPDLYVYPATESDPGHLAVRSPRRPDDRATTRPQHRAQRDQNPLGRRPAWRPARLAWDRAAVDFTRSKSDDRTRVVVRIEGTTERVYTGVVAWPSADPNVAVARVDLELAQVSPQQVVVHRIFRLTRALPVTETESGPEQSDGYRTYLAGERHPLPGELLGDRQVKLRVPWSVPVGEHWTSTVPLAEADEPWVEANYPPHEIRVVLHEQQNKLVASYRNVPALSLEEAVPFLQRQGLVPGVMTRLRQPLRYIERREVGSEAVHRFEWGYGWTLSVPENRLRVAGREAGSWPITPFHGDAVSEVSIESLPDGQPVLNVGQLGFDYGWRSQFFHDSAAGLVTLAEIDSEANGSARIQALQLRWRRGPDGDDTAYRDDRRMPVRDARLHLDAARAIQAALAAETSTGGPARAFVRLRLDDFRRSGGRVMQFDFVRPVLGATDGLQERMLVFLEAGEIEELTNDVRLHLRPGALLGERAGRAFTVHVRRREFSARQDLLRQIHQGGDRLQGDVYLVRLQAISEDRSSAEGQIRLSLPRSLRVLRSFLSSDRSVLGIVEPRHRGGEAGYTLELRPNVLFNLTQTDIAAPERLARGTFVRVSSGEDGRIMLVRALPGDHAYLPSDGRPAVLLPMQDLFRRNQSLEEALAQGHYTVAGLPGIAVRANAPGALPARFSERLITRVHPKVAMVRDSGQGSYHVAPLDDTARAGILVIRSDGTVHARGVGQDETHRIPWAQVSFLDDGRNVVRDRCTDSWWQYHDDTTARRHPRPPHTPQPARPLPDRATATSEPVFFSAEWSLRHPARRLRRFGFSARELIEGTHGRGERTDLRLPVAGVTAPGGRADGLWVEIAPGRVVELVGSMMTTADSGRTWLDRVDWSHFSPGDLIHLSVQRGHRLDIGSLALSWWRPGPRGGLGSRALLPVASIDPKREFATLGHGATKLRFPLETDGPAYEPGNLVWLGADNNVEAVSEPHLAAGDVVLMEHVGGRLQIIGAAELECEIGEYPGGPWTHGALHENPAELLALSGGSLPMTVEHVEARRVRLSRRLQRDGDLPVGEVVPGVPLGRLGRFVVFRSGSRLHRCRCSDALPGIPEGLIDPALELLRRLPQLQWLRGAPGHKAIVGLPAQRTGAHASGELRVRVIGVIGRGAEYGLLTWEADERRPRWLPAEQTGWRTPTQDELTHAFVPRSSRKNSSWLDQQPEIHVSVRHDGSVSITGTAANRHRLEQLRVGDRLRVDVLGTAGQPIEPGRVGYLARVYLSDLLLQLQTSDALPPPEPGRPRWCELEAKQRSGETTVVRVCEPGIRRVQMAVPSWAGRGSVGDLNSQVPYPEPAWTKADAMVVAAADAAAANPASIEEAVEPSRIWLRATGEQLFGLAPASSLELVPALSVCTLLASLGEAGVTAAAEAAVHVARQLGLRATASRHLEPMLRLWMSAESRATQPEMWRRLANLPLAATIPAAEVERIRKVDDALRNRATLRRSPDVILASACVASTVGAHTSFDEIHEDPGILGGLAALGRALVPPSSALLAQAALLPQQTAFLTDLRRRAQVAYRITLLPLPPFLHDPRLADARSLLDNLI